MIYIVYSVGAILFIGIVFFVLNRYQSRSAVLNEDQSRYDSHRNDLLHILASHEAKKLAAAEAAAKEEQAQQEHEREQESAGTEADGEPT